MPIATATRCRACSKSLRSSSRLLAPPLFMTSKQGDHRTEPSDEQVADLKKAIADLAESKRVMSDSTGSEPSGAERPSDADTAPTLLQIASRYKWPLASGIVGILLGIFLSTL